MNILKISFLFYAAVLLSCNLSAKRPVMTAGDGVEQGEITKLLWPVPAADPG